MELKAKRLESLDKRVDDYGDSDTPGRKMERVTKRAREAIKKDRVEDLLRTSDPEQTKRLVRILKRLDEPRDY